MLTQRGVYIFLKFQHVVTSTEQKQNCFSGFYFYYQLLLTQAMHFAADKKISISKSFLAHPQDNAKSSLISPSIDSLSLPKQCSEAYTQSGSHIRRYVIHGDEIYCDRLMICKPVKCTCYLTIVCTSFLLSFLLAANLRSDIKITLKNLKIYALYRKDYLLLEFKNEQIKTTN